MKLGITLGHHFAPGEDGQEVLRALLRQVELAEELGFESVFLGHHYLTRSEFLQPLSLAAFLAARTSRIRIGFGVLLLPLLNPVAVAEELATLDVLSGGRVIAGFGSGYRSTEFRAFGVDFESRFRLLAAHAELCRRLWRGEAVTAQWPGGRLDEARILLRPAQPGGPPLWLGAFGPVGIRRAARLGATWLGPPGGDLESLCESLAVYRDALPADALAPEEQPLLREGLLAPTAQAAALRCRPFLEQQYAEYRGWKHGETIDSLLEGRTLVGDAETVAGRLRAYEAAGFDHVIVRMSWTGLPAEQTEESIRILGSEVLPAL